MCRSAVRPGRSIGAGPGRLDQAAAAPSGGQPSVSHRPGNRRTSATAGGVPHTAADAAWVASQGMPTIVQPVRVPACVGPQVVLGGRAAQSCPQALEVGLLAGPDPAEQLPTRLSGRYLAEFRLLVGVQGSGAEVHGFVAGQPFHVDAEGPVGHSDQCHSSAVRKREVQRRGRRSDRRPAVCLPAARARLPHEPHFLGPPGGIARDQSAQRNVRRGVEQRVGGADEGVGPGPFAVVELGTGQGIGAGTSGPVDQPQVDPVRGDGEVAGLVRTGQADQGDGAGVQGRAGHVITCGHVGCQHALPVRLVRPGTLKGRHEASEVGGGPGRTRPPGAAAR